MGAELDDGVRYLRADATIMIEGHIALVTEPEPHFNFNIYLCHPDGGSPLADAEYDLLTMLRDCNRSEAEHAETAALENLIAFAQARLAELREH